MSGPAGARRAALGLGSNLGASHDLLQGAVTAVASAPDVTAVAVSPAYRTTPDGGPDGQPDYLNAVLVIDTTLEPAELLALAHRVEQAAGRVRTERFGPRTLDVDLLAVDGAVSSDPELTLPHPRAHLRAFVLCPWADVDPDFVVPGRGRVADLAEATDRTGVWRSDLALELPA